MAAGNNWRWHHYWPGICCRLYCKPMAGVGSLGLQPDARQYLGAGMPAVFYSMVAGIAGRDRAG